jgi:anti-sigma factor RsiW
MIERLRTLATPRRHPRPSALSRYLEGELAASDRQALEAHLRGCGRCRRLLASLETTLHELGSLTEQAPDGLADSIIDALRAETPDIAPPIPSQGPARSPTLTVVPASGDAPAADRGLARWRQSITAGLLWCLQPRQLRLTLPITIVAGVALSLVNMGGMLIHGTIDAGVCVMCATDFLVPFIALNVALLIVLRAPLRTRSGARRDHVA